MTGFMTNCIHRISRRNLAIWLILSSIMVSITACGTPRNVRGGRYIQPTHRLADTGRNHEKTDTKKDELDNHEKTLTPVSTHTLSQMLDSISNSYQQQSAVNPPEITTQDDDNNYSEQAAITEDSEEEFSITDFEPLAIADDDEAPQQTNVIQPVEAVNNSPEPESKPTPRLPSLQQQLKSLQKDQKEMKQDVDNLKNDVKDIKTTLNKIKQHLDDQVVSPEPVKGPQTQPVSTPKPNVIQPEEAKTEAVATVVTSRQTNSSVAENQDVVQTQDIKSEYDNALDYLQNKQYNRAIRQLKRVVSNIKDDDKRNNCNYWLGKSHYYLEQYQKAIAYFYYVLRSESQNMKDDAQIMIAESHIRSGQVPEAKKAYQSLIKEYPDSRLVPKARKMLQQL